MIIGVKDNINKILFSFVLFIFCVGCAAPTDMLEEETLQYQKIPTEPEQSFYMHWTMAKQPIIPGDDFVLNVYATILSGNETIIIYSITGFDLAKLNVILRDDKERTAELESADTFMEIDDVSFGTMKFGSRPIGSSELYLAVGENGDEENPETNIAIFNYPPEPQHLHSGRTYSGSSSGDFEMDNLIVSFAGWFDPPIPFENYVRDLPEGVSVKKKATLLIEDKEKDEVIYLYLQFLSNGEIRGTKVQ